MEDFEKDKEQENYYFEHTQHLDFGTDTKENCTHQKRTIFNSKYVCEDCGETLIGKDDTPAPLKSEGWEEQWSNFMMKFVFNEENVKDFIHQLLSDQRQEMVDSVMGILVKNSPDMETIAGIQIWNVDVERFKKDLQALEETK